MAKKPKMIVFSRSTFVGKDGKKWRVTCRAPLLSPEERSRREMAFFRVVHEVLSQQRNSVPVK